jgi:hypothetical protein
MEMNFEWLRVERSSNGFVRKTAAGQRFRCHLGSGG